jgi:hypothetical protein
MANDLTPLGMMQLAAPNQAASIFNPDAPHPIRQKHLFAVRFMRPAGTNDAVWRNGLTFVVKSMDRPSIQPQVEELNQYNKKRLVHTGVKYQPVSCTLYDTADGAAMNMWVDYARYYFNDYKQATDNYKDDILNDDMFDSTVDKSGFGFGIDNTAMNEGIDSQHFFTSIIVYQVWGNEFTSYELVNPRINSFQPDDLSYEASEANTITMSISFEAVSHVNTGRPQDIFTEESLTAMFAGGPFDGKVLEVDGPPKINSFVGIAPDFEGTAVNGIFSDGGISALSDLDGIERTTMSSDGGVLNRFGTFDFGTLDRTLGAPVTAGVSQAIGGSAALANILRGNFSGGVNSTIGGGAMVTQVDSAVGDAPAYVDGLATGIRTAAKKTGITPYDLAARSEDGLQLSNATVNGVNQTRSGVSQIGNNTAK